MSGIGLSYFSEHFFLTILECPAATPTRVLTHVDTGTSPLVEESMKHNCIDWRFLGMCV